MGRDEIAIVYRALIAYRSSLTQSLKFRKNKKVDVRDLKKDINCVNTLLLRLSSLDL